ncbi:hypothetical protein HMPREF0631_1368 [Peptostreptococcus anaerobius 653-L]|uniref:Uncharacterized protein n=1 Tax=Peptostreptococcus anaerobius 653-L TaxID=596329 RepID=D3MU62_9FIRM|nr:hypothetical protein [Peptostreptococcus anaerobius]EFD04340.1 hypothetical protein HMPREF0631_1368 [Peptostreptococcus anaerobius 653-L]
MYSSLVIFRNELKSKNVQKYKIIGIISEIILSKKLFVKNSEIDEFVYEILGVSFKDYVYKSRTMVVAKITRIIYNSDEMHKFQKSTYVYVSKKIEEYKELNNKGNGNSFDGWI